MGEVGGRIRDDRRADPVAPPATADLLMGRHADLAVIRTFLAKATLDGDALLLSGEAGAGKSVLLDVAAETAPAGTTVLRGAGVEYLAELSFSGAAQVLSALRPEFGRLGPAHRDALSAALGMAGSPTPDALVVFSAALTLLRRVADAQPLLIVVDDLHWLDRASATLLTFVARRLTGSRVGFLAAHRPTPGSAFADVGLRQHEVRPLDEGSAARLVRARHPALAPAVVTRVLAEAGGNPLALLELPAALSPGQRAAEEALPPILPLGRRLHSLFAARVEELPATTRRLLLLAALEGSGDLEVVLSVGPDAAGLADLAPAERAQLVQVDTGAQHVSFRHSLVRSTVVETSTSAERRAAHRALATALHDEPDARAWHLAGAAAGPDEEVAALLEATARVGRGRGDAVGAVTALLRAADLSPDGAGRSRRLAEAAAVSAEVTGNLNRVAQLLVEARRADPDVKGSLQAAIAAAALLLHSDGDVGTAHRLLAGAIETRAGGYDSNDSALPKAVSNLATICLFAGRSEMWDRFDAITARSVVEVPPVLHLVITILADPARTSGADLARLRAAVRDLDGDDDPVRITRVAMVALFVDRAADCRQALWRVVEDGRRGGAVASAITALIVLHLDDVLTGRWEQAQQLAEEGLRTCAEHGYHLLAWPFRLGPAMVAAMRGDDATNRQLTDEMRDWSQPRGIMAIGNNARYARVLAAMGRSDFEEAYLLATEISPAGELAPHVPQALWVCMDLVEAAVRTGRHGEAASHVEALRQAGSAQLSPRLALLVGGAAALSARADAGVLFEQALAVPDAQRWPFDVARVQLCYGEHLRRSRRTGPARTQLAAALETFDRLGARPWADRARGELRATGLAAPRSGPVRRVLTPEERHIAALAASGLSNKEIAQRLFVSPRTVAARLYQIFPKLGVSSRAALRDALTDPTADPPDDPAA